MLPRPCCACSSAADRRTCQAPHPQTPNRPQLNPGAVLNHKYSGENAVRAAGLTYAVLRPTGLTNESEPGEFLLEASQGEGASWRATRCACRGVLSQGLLVLPAQAGRRAGRT